MSARSSRLRGVIGSAFAVVGLLTGWLFASATLFGLNPSTLRDLGSNDGFILLMTIALLAIIFAFGKAGMWLYDVICSYRKRQQRH